MKRVNEKKIENVLAAVISVFLFAVFLNLYKEGLILVGVGQDGEYFSSNMRKIVVGVQKNKSGETIPIFNEYRNKPNTAIEESIKIGGDSKEDEEVKLISQVLPPNYLLVYDRKEFMISAWLHTGFIPDIMQNIALKIRFSESSLRVVNFISLMVFILSFLPTSRLWFGWRVAFLSTALVLISSPFFFFSISGPTCGRYYFLSLTFFSVSFLFLSKFIFSGAKINLILSAIFCGFSVSSYFRGGTILTLIMSALILLLMNVDMKKKVIYTILFSFISFSFFLPTFIFWVVFLSYDSVLPRPDDLTLFSFFPRSGLKFILGSFQEEIDVINSVKIAIYDILTLYDFRFMGNDLWLDYKYQIDYRYSIFSLFFLLSITGEKKTKVLFALSMLYIFLEAITFRNPGFPRRFFFVYPIMLLCITSGLLETRKSIYKLLFLFFLVIFSYTQVKADRRIIKGLKEGIYYEIMSYKVQKNIISEVETNAKEIINVSCVMNFPLLSSGKIEVEDWSYIYAITRRGETMFLRMLADRLLSGRSEKTLITCLLPFPEIEKYFVERGLKVKRIKNFYGGSTKKNIISTIFTVEWEEKHSTEKNF